MTELQMVKFTRSCSPYTIGEIASFKPPVAAKLLASGVCEYVAKEAADDDDQQDDDDGVATGAQASAEADAGAKERAATKRVRVR